MTNETEQMMASVRYNIITTARRWMLHGPPESVKLAMQVRELTSSDPRQTTIAFFEAAAKAFRNVWDIEIKPTLSEEPTVVIKGYRK